MILEGNGTEGKEKENNRQYNILRPVLKVKLCVSLFSILKERQQLCCFGFDFFEFWFLDLNCQRININGIVSSFRFPFKSDERRTMTMTNLSWRFYRMLAKKEMWKEDVSTKVKAEEEAVEEEEKESWGRWQTNAKAATTCKFFQFTVNFTLIFLYSFL